MYQAIRYTQEEVEELSIGSRDHELMICSDAIGVLLTSQADQRCTAAMSSLSIACLTRPEHLSKQNVSSFRSGPLNRRQPRPEQQLSQCSRGQERERLDPGRKLWNMLVSLLVKRLGNRSGIIALET